MALPQIRIEDSDDTRTTMASRSPRIQAIPVPVWVSDPKMLEDYFQPSIIQAIQRLNMRSSHSGAWRQNEMKTWERADYILKEAGKTPWMKNTMNRFDESFSQILTYEFRRNDFMKRELESLDRTVAMLHEIPQAHRRRLHDFTITRVAFLLEQCSRHVEKNRVAERRAEPRRLEKPKKENFIKRCGRMILAFYENWLHIMNDKGKG